MSKAVTLEVHHDDNPAQCLSVPPVNHPIDRNSPAILGMMDFCHQHPLRMGAHAPATAALAVFQSSDIADILVCNREGFIIGVLGRSDVQDGRILKVVHDQKKPRALVEIEDLMTPIAKIGRIGLRDACKSSINDIIHAMHGQGEQKLMVTKNGLDRSEISGLFSLDLFAQILHQGELTQDLEAYTFADLEKRLVPIEIH